MRNLWQQIEQTAPYRRVSRHKVAAKLLNRETVSYVFFGVLTTVVSIGSYVLFLWIFEKNGLLAGESASLAALMDKHTWLGYVPNLSQSLRAFVANMISWVFAVLFSFVTNKWFVFQSKSRHPCVVVREFAGFVASRVFSLAAESAVIILFISGLGTGEVFAKIAGQVVVLVLNYLLSKLVVFRKPAR